MTGDSAPFRLAQLESLERTHDVFAITVDGIAPWELARWEVASTLRRELTGAGAAHDTPEGVTAMLRAGKLTLRNFLWRNPYRAAPADICVVGHPRRQRGPDGRWWDIYCDPLFADSDYEVAHFEFSDFLTHRRPPRTPDLRYLDLIDIPGIAAAELPVPLSRQQRQTVERFAPVEEAITAEFDLQVGVRRIIAGELRRRAVLRPLYERLLQRVDPELLVLVVSYGRGMKMLTEVAKTLEIPVVELQHGIIDGENAGYNFPDDIDVGLFPDWILTFGEFWATQAKFPVERDRILSAGFSWLEERAAEFSDIKTQDHLLFISQGTVGAELSRFAVDCAHDHRIEHDVVYKLHPGEVGQWRDAYPWLVESKVRVIGREPPALYKLFSRSQGQVGVGSTAMYEGLYFGLSTYIYETEGAEALKPLVEAGVAVPIDSVDELARYLQQERTKLEPGKYFAGDSIEKQKSALNYIMDCYY